ncbi:hypothetical protein [Rhodococcus qingshengii]|uniref:Uncharacterized protein n=1 Tax=Rhodococcus qingshengii JCM 15477 TaxID=1303681 RepID=A0AB38R9P0_RHOSG|nr:hypothetical protein [Rhodococcus qingshengii]UPU41474.1 hypothetical protein M0639_20865 [Rhodococcus qingshengii JCM 15477]
MTRTNRFPSRISARRPLELVGLALLVVLVVCATALAVRQNSAAGNGRSALTAETTVPQLPPDTAPASMWFGDSFTAGINGIGLGAYPRIICVRMGWDCNVDAQGSTGFTNDGAPEYQGATTRFENRLQVSIVKGQ